MSVPAFADIGKVTRELLFGGKAGKFQYDKSVTFKTKANDNVEFTLNSVMKATSVTSELKAAFKLPNGISTDISLKPDWKAAVSASSIVVPGLKTTLSGIVPDPHSGQMLIAAKKDGIYCRRLGKDISSGELSTLNAAPMHFTYKVKVEYNIDHLSVKASSTLTSKPNLEVAVSSGANGFVVGGEVGYSVEKAAPTKYGAAAVYLGKGFGLALFSADMMKTVKAAYHQELDATSSVAVELAAKPSEVGLGGFVLGFSRQLDSGALAKAKIDQDGLLSLLYETVLEKHLKLALSMQMDALNMDGKKNKFGMALEFS